MFFPAVTRYNNFEMSELWRQTANYNQIYENLIITNWDNVIKCDFDLQKSYDTLLSILYREIAQHVPVNRSKSVKPVKNPPHIRNLLNKKLFVYNQCSRNCQRNMKRR